VCSFTIKIPFKKRHIKKVLLEINKMQGLDYNKGEDEAGDKRSEGSCKMNKSRKIKKPLDKA
jgi:hypothetical protein